MKPWQTKSYKECQDDLVKFANKRDIPLDTPWYALDRAQQKWVIEGEGKWEKKVWYGAKRFFEWLETKAYKMHVRVLAVAISRVHALHCLRRLAAQARRAAVEDRRPERPRPRVAVAGQVPRIFRNAAAAGAARRGGGPVARRGARALCLSMRSGPGVSHARPPVAHACRAARSSAST